MFKIKYALRLTDPREDRQGRVRRRHVGRLRGQEGGHQADEGHPDPERSEVSGGGLSHDVSRSIIRTCLISSPFKTFVSADQIPTAREPCVSAGNCAGGEVPKDRHGIHVQGESPGVPEV